MCGRAPGPKIQAAVLGLAWCGVGLVARATRGALTSAYGLAEPSRWGGAAEPLGGGIVFGESKPVFYGGGSGLHRLLRDVEERYSDAFAELGPGALADLKRCIESVKAFLDLLWDDETGFGAKLINYAKISSGVFEFCRYHTRWLENPLMERLNAEISEVLEQAVSWWERQENYNATER